MKNKLSILPGLVLTLALAGSALAATIQVIKQKPTQTGTVSNPDSNRGGMKTKVRRHRKPKPKTDVKSDNESQKSHPAS